MGKEFIQVWVSRSTNKLNLIDGSYSTGWGHYLEEIMVYTLSCLKEMFEGQARIALYSGGRGSGGGNCCCAVTKSCPTSCTPGLQHTRPPCPPRGGNKNSGTYHSAKAKVKTGNSLDKSASAHFSLIYLNNCLLSLVQMLASCPSLNKA